MAVGGPEPSWDVIIEYGDPSMKRLYNLPVSTSIDEIMRKWSNDVNIEVKNGTFVTCEGSRIEGDKFLKEIAEIAPGVGIVRLCYFEEDDIPVGIYGGLYSSPKFRARLSQPPGRLFPEIRRLFHAAEEQDFRLWSHRGLLNSNVPLAAQGINENTPLFVEIALDLEFLDTWDKIAIRLESVFASDDCEEVLKLALKALKVERELDDVFPADDAEDNAGVHATAASGGSIANGVDVGKTSGVSGSSFADGVDVDKKSVASRDRFADGLHEGFDDDFNGAICNDDLEFQFDVDGDEVDGAVLPAKDEIDGAVFPVRDEVDGALFPVRDPHKTLIDESVLNLLVGDSINQPTHDSALNRSIGDSIVEEPIIRIHVADCESDSAEDYQSIEGLPLDQLELFRSASTVEVMNLRIVLNQQRIYFSGEVLDSLSIFGAPWIRFFNLEMESEREVAIVEGKSVRTAMIWPSDKKSKLTEAAILYGNRPIDGDKALRDLDLPQLGVLIEAPISLTLRLTSDECSILRLSIAATVGDVRRAACGLEDRNFVQLRESGRLLDADDWSLWQAGIDGDSEIQVELNSVEMRLRIRGNDIVWRPERPSLTFGDIATAILSQTDIPYWEIRDMTFCCVGCKRKISRDNQSILTLPSLCCPSQSCEMELWNPTLVSDAWKKSEMASIWAMRVRIKEQEDENAELLARSRKKSTRLAIYRKRIDRLLTENFNLQADNAFLEGQVQELTSYSSKMKSSKSSLEIRLQELQQQLSTMHSHAFRIVNWCSDFNGGDNFDVELTLSRSPTVGELRAALATHMGRCPSKTKLRRDIGVSEGHLVFDVGPEEKFVYADASGNIRDSVTVINKKRERLVKDSEVVTIVPNRRNSLWVMGR